MKHTTRLGWATALFTLVFAGTSLAVHRAHSAAREEVAVHLTELRAERESRSFEREALWGETEPGEAWPHYAEALAAVESLREHPIKTRVLVAVEPGVDDAERAAVLAAFPPEAFAALRRGAHARDGAIAIDWEAGFDRPFMSLVDVRALLNGALLEVLVAGPPAEQMEAVRRLLDALQLTGDLMESPTLISEMVGVGTVALRDLDGEMQRGLADRLAEPAKRELLAGLRRLEARISPESHAMLGELELLGHSFTRGWTPELSRDASGVERVMGYLDGEVVFDLHVAEHMRRVREAAPRVTAAYGLPYDEGHGRIEAIADEFAASGNPLSVKVVLGAPSAFISRVEGRARLSFLRAALEAHLGEDGAPPFDPFGAGVTIDEDEDGRVRVSTPMPARRSGPGARVLEVVL